MRVGDEDDGREDRLQDHEVGEEERLEDLPGRGRDLARAVVYKLAVSAYTCKRAPRPVPLHRGGERL